jgi:hypothetical protein
MGETPDLPVALVGSDRNTEYAPMVLLRLAPALALFALPLGTTVYRPIIEQNPALIIISPKPHTWRLGLCSRGTCVTR